MPEIDVRKYTYGQKRRKSKKKQNPLTVIAAGLLPWNGDSVSDIVRKVVFLVSLTALTVSAILIAQHYLGGHEGSTNTGYYEPDFTNENFTRIVYVGSSTNADGTHNDEQYEVEILERYADWYKKNNDMVGYISIDPYINYPVVQPLGDKEFDHYLNHNFENRPTTNGTIFACKYVTFTPYSRPHNTIIHGHNLLTRNNFQPLLKYLDSQRNVGFDFLKDNFMIKFDTIYEPGMYKIFSVFQTTINESQGEFFDYLRKRTFDSQDDFYEYVTEVLDRSRYHTPVDLRYGDEILTLSTCDFSILGDIRLVIVARRVRYDEVGVMNPEEFINLRENPTKPRSPGRNAEGLMRYKMFESFYNSSNSGRGWAGREWDISRVEGLEEWLKQTGFTGVGR